MGWLGDWLGGLPPVLVYAVVAALVAGEAALIAGVLLPSATGLIALGLLANAGVVDVIPSLVVATAAAVLGGTLGYHQAARTARRTPANSAPTEATAPAGTTTTIPAGTGAALPDRTTADTAGTGASLPDRTTACTASTAAPNRTTASTAAPDRTTASISAPDRTTASTAAPDRTTASISAPDRTTASTAGADRTTASNTSAPHFGGATSARTSSSTGASSAGAERPRSGKLAKHWARAERLFVRYGGRAIFLGQWVVGARTLMPRLAGRNGVPYRRFAAWHTPSATLWAVWMVGASYLAGASYQVLAARAGRAAGALTTLTLIVAGLILAGRWLGRHPFPVRPPHRTSPIQGFAARWHPAVTAAVSLSLLTALALLLIEVIPPVVRFSGLAAADEALATWSRSQWTSDGYLFALSTATSLSPRIPLTLAVAVALVRLWWPHRPPALCRSPRPTPQAPTRTTPHPAPHTPASTTPHPAPHTPASTTPHPAPHNPAHAASHPAPHTPAGTTPQPAPHTPAGTTPQPAPHNPAHAASHPTPHPAGTTPQPAPQNPGRTTSHPAPDTPTRTEQRTGTNSRAAVHRLGAWLRSGLEAWKRHGLWSGLFKVAGPVLPAVVLETALAVIPHSGWRATDHLVFPSPVEFDGPVPLDAAAAALADMSAAATVQTAAALGLLAWLLSHGLPWKWQVTVWTSASVVIVTGAGCWVYLGWGRLSETVAAVLLGAAWAALNAAIWSSRTTPAPTPTAPAAANPTPELAPAPA